MGRNEKLRRMVLRIYDTRSRSIRTIESDTAATGTEAKPMILEPPGNNQELALLPTNEDAGSDTPDCCTAWTRSGRTLEPAMMSAWATPPVEAEMRFKFCPWCGRARPNEKLSHNAQPTRKEAESK